MPIIGVGEGTWPTLRIHSGEDRRFRNRFLSRMRCRLQAGRQVSPAGRPAPRTTPIITRSCFPRALRSSTSCRIGWRAGTHESFCDAVCPQGKICDDGLAPKTIATPEYEAVANYAYHLDAGKFAPFLQRHCSDKARRAPCPGRRAASRTWPRTATSAAIDTEQAGEIEGDLFVDCTGFSALLIGEALGVPFKDCSDVLFCDTALADPGAVRRATAPDRRRTRSPPRSPPGWIWDIGLPDAVAASAMSIPAATFPTTRPSASCAPISGRPAKDLPVAQDPDPRRPPRNVLEAQLRRRRPRRRLPRAARSPRPSC